MAMSDDPTKRRSAIMGAACAGVGLATGLLILYFSGGLDKATFLLAAPAAAFATGALLWWQMLERSGTRTIGRGALAGGLAGALAHYPCWLMLMFAAAACHAVFPGCMASVGGPPIDPLNALWAAGVYSLFSLYFVGWLTVPAGAVIGAVLAWRWFRETPDELSDADSVQ